MPRVAVISAGRRPARRIGAAAAMFAGGLAAIIPASTAMATTPHWVAEASIPTSTCGGTATVARGGDGRIYWFCGSRSEAYTPGTNTWRTFAADPVNRAESAAAEGPHGAILVVGGCCDGSGNALQTAEFYSPSTNAWSTVASMPTARMSLALTYAAGKFYALGGTDAQGNTMSTVEEFNPSSGTWSAGPDLPQDACNLGAVTGSDGRVYAFGGMHFNCNAQPGWQGLNTADALNTSTGVWTAVKNIPTDHTYVGRSQFGITVGSDNRIYIIGGLEGSDCCGPGTRETPTVLRYTIGTNSWSFIVSLPSTGALYDTLGAATSAGSHGKVYVFGAGPSGTAVYKFTS
jgi:N-acetylneuraminic acid mutarotase